MDTVFLKGVRVEAVIGVHEWERARSRPLLVDLEMAADAAAAAASDAIDDALDYDAIATKLRSLAEATRFQLIETLADHLAAAVREEFAVPWLRLTVHKPGAVRGVHDLGVTIERGERT
ncbi:MAG: dihydroneopterin aldolase [Ectothiorhodospiraceae bacterium]